MLTPSEERRLDEIERELDQDPTLCELCSALSSAGRPRPARVWRVTRWVLGCVAAMITIMVGMSVSPAIGITAGVVVVGTVTTATLILRHRYRPG
ncbi:MAG: DUF3040 domain-containing protein [Microlunatus sp.]|nr:DUF3040 domain-containing protein [Microlunatus sp.]